MIRVLIIEDESHAAERLTTLVEKCNNGAKVINVCQSVKSSIDWLEKNDLPDLIYSDIQLGDGLSFEIFQNVTLDCPIVFVTAFDSYAIKAFEVFSIDYILKPYDIDQIKASFTKFQLYKSKIGLPKNVFNQIEQVFTKDYKTRFISQNGENVFTISIDDVSCFVFEDGTVVLISTEDKKYVLSHSLDAIEALIDPARFFRINRKIIIRYDSISKIEYLAKQRIGVYVKGLDDRTPSLVSRRRSASFKQWIDQ